MADIQTRIKKLFDSLQSIKEDISKKEGQKAEIEEQLKTKHNITDFDDIPKQITALKKQKSLLDERATKNLEQAEKIIEDNS